MSTPWEIDPTESDRDGAGAEGGAMGGDSAGDSNLPPPLQPPEDIDRTNPFKPTSGTSTPYPSDSFDEQQVMRTKKKFFTKPVGSLKLNSPMLIFKN